MSKRFSETTIWEDPWFRRLSPGLKCLWQYICAKCDAAGVIDFDPEHATFHIGYEVTYSDLENFGERTEKLPSGKIWIRKFLDFQYGTVDAKCPAHKPVIKAIVLHCLKYPINNLSDTVSNTAKEKSKDKEEEKETDKEMKKTDLQKRAEKLFNKRDGTDWDPSEVRAWKACKSVIEKTTDEEWILLEWLYSKDGEPHFPKTSFSTLMNNWSGEISKAKKAKDNPSRKNGFEQPKPTHWAEGRNPNFIMTEDIKGD